MGPRRRPGHIHTAAVLPASRLPLGTPNSANPTFARSQPHDSSFSSSSSNSPPTAPLPPTPLKPTTNTNNKHSRMDANDASEDPQNYKSIADAKLERQRKRIEEAEAALRATSPSRDKRNAPVISQRKQARHADNLRSSDISGPVSEVRISSIRVVSRESSLARPLSVLSQRTSDTGTSELDPYDGFHVIRGRRSRKDELNPRGDRPEPRQTTVEATFDKRDIYETFGNALPAPEFIEENPGSTDGQLQFVQHPNGDVSAHQWSSNRFMWENIGQFSNIRKKVEGQLAADRLKGETAHQKLQQNTLTYFHTIAKQREAQTMGLPFGPKEIQAAMPAPLANDTLGASNDCKDTFKEQTSPAAIQAQPRPRLEATIKPPDAPEVTLSRPSLVSANSQSIPHYQSMNTLAFGLSYAPQMGAYPDDPFYAASQYQRIYSQYPQHEQGYRNPVMPQATASGSSYGDMTKHQLNYDFHFPPPGAASRTAPAQSSRSRGEYNISQANMTAQPSVRDTSYALAGSQNPSYRPLTSYITSYPPITSSGEDNNTSARPRPDTPYGSRTSMSDQLWKISETAKERNVSQTSISRTVLYDPYQKHPSLSTVSRTSDMEKLEDQPCINRSVASCSRYPSRFDATPSHGPIMADSKSINPTPLRDSFSESLQDSSPDTYWSKRPYSLSASKLQATLQNFDGPFFPSDPNTASTPSSASKKSYDEELNNWWTSGNKFSRQQEFYESIAAANKPKESVLPTPIGPPSRTPVKEGSQPFNPITTRLLIPVLESLASYVQGPLEKRRDYFCPWTTAPEWAIDRSETGNHSFYDAGWGQPPARVGRDPRYSGRLSWSAERTPPAGRFSSPMSGPAAACPMRRPGRMAQDQRFAISGRF